MNIYCKQIRISSSHIPKGKLLYVNASGKNLPKINAALVRKGVLHSPKVEGDTRRYASLPLTSLDYQLITFDWEESRIVEGKEVGRNPRIFALPSRSEVATKGEPDETGEFQFLSFSSQSRYLCIKWGRKEPAPGDGAISGIGIYDSQTQQTWRQEGGTLTAWSASGQEFVFARYFLKGNYFSEQEADRFRFPNDYFDRPAEEILPNMHFFVKSVRDLQSPNAMRISQAQAVRLVGPWYQAVLQYAAGDRFNTETVGNIVAPRGRGAILVRTRNTSGGIWFPNDLELAHSAQFVDAEGHAFVYNPSVPVGPLSWSRDGERVYGITGNSVELTLDKPALICFWVLSGRFAIVPLPQQWHGVVSYIED